MIKQYSPEVLTLRDRVILGNKKLNDAWKQICKIDNESQEWRDLLEQWHQANKKLSSIGPSHGLNLRYKIPWFMNIDSFRHLFPPRT
ncbi:unnamed protein product [marine sediment metagenome]|uniref:Uncharacterized protein n=1 Tax=marine sediment metagenome TaxID=412755 RepID=X1U4L2_9ZZZZ